MNLRSLFLCVLALPAVTEAQPVVIRNVSVIPMTADSMIPNATVVIQDGRIADVRTRSGSVPRGARVIDGSGKYLIPGLADMHAHLFSDGEFVHDSAGAAELAAMVANGVTSARLMIGTPEQLALRQAVASGKVLGPTLWISSPQFTGRPAENASVVTTPEQARDGVKSAKAAGYDFIKLTQFITMPVYDAIVSEAKALGIKVVGHVDPEVGVGRALAAGQQLEHLDGYFEAVLADSSPVKVSVTQAGLFRGANWVSLDHVDDRKVDSIAAATAKAGVFVGPTHNIFNTAFAIGESETLVKSRPDWNIWPPKLREGYLNALRRYWDSTRTPQRTPARMKRYLEVRNRLLKVIQDSGGKILAGSDTPEWFHSYGWALHRELQSLAGAGLTPRQALAAATTTPAEFLGVAGRQGSISKGKRADLVLLSANPLIDIRNTEKIEAVAVGGRWLDRKQLDALLASAVARIQAATHNAP
jgi:imidazolonepropionase-like amidohydrolase